MPNVVSNPSFVPRSVPAAIKALEILEGDVDKAETYEEIRRIERQAGAIKIFWQHVEAVRKKAEMVIVVANHRIGQEIVAPHGGRRRSSDIQYHLTLFDQVGSQMRGRQLKKLGSYSRSAVKGAVRDLWDVEREATITGILKKLKGDDPPREIVLNVRLLVKRIVNQLDKRFTVEGDKLQQALNVLSSIDEEIETADRRRVEQSLRKMIARAQRFLDSFSEHEAGSRARVVSLNQRRIEDGTE